MRELALAVALLCAAPAAAEEAATRVPLPLEAPAGVHPLLADFLAICSAGVRNLAEGMTVGIARGWTFENGGDAPGWLMAVAGNVVLTKDGVQLLINRATFPHLNAVNCQMFFAGERPAGFDTAPIGTIPGVEGAKAAFGTETVGRWSFVDGDGEVVTIVDTVVSERMGFLAMARATRTAKAGGR